MPVGKIMRQRGFTYLVLLFIVALMGAVLASTAMVWHTVTQREKEQELLFAGRAFRQAIGYYYQNTPGDAKQYPKKLEDLLEDKRQPTLTRYLRKIYIDPMTASNQWGLVTEPDGSIMGVYSLSQSKPIKIAGFASDEDYNEKDSYQQWRFIYKDPLQTTQHNLN